MRVLRLYDADRRPASWMEIVRPGQFALFAKDLDSGAACDLDGRRFDDPEAGTCALCDSLAEARIAADAAVARTPPLRIDVFDAEGRAQPPLLTVLHPSRAQTVETHPRVLRTRRTIAWTLIALGIPLIVYACLGYRDHDIILPAFIGINMLIAAGRLLWFNLGVRETERTREDRLRRHEPAAAPPHDC